MRIQLKPEDFFHLINHGPCVLVGSGDETEKNIAPITWTMPLNDEPPLVALAIAESHHTAALIRKSKEFVMNVMGEDSLDKLFSCGKVHGVKTDKFKKFGLTPLPCQKIKTPYLKESLAHIECSLIAEHPYDGVSLFIGKVLSASVEEDLWDGKYLKIEKAKTVHHTTENRFAVTERIIQAKNLNQP